MNLDEMTVGQAFVAAASIWTTVYFLVIAVKTAIERRNARTRHR
jgi:hypothetical protein